jgi:hypothetical protein|tara:strand:+ start:550 stop:834 length:285 start_codon:yes stop_codon:yes gene_type:complete
MTIEAVQDMRSLMDAIEQGLKDNAEYIAKHGNPSIYAEATSSPGRVKRSGASCKGSATSLRKKAKDTSGEKSKMYHWCANMKAGKKKSIREVLD